jgi:prefoldin subunit 5
MKVSKKEIIIRLIRQVYNYSDEISHLKDKIKELEDYIKKIDESNG